MFSAVISRAYECKSPRRLTIESCVLAGGPALRSGWQGENGDGTEAAY